MIVIQIAQLQCEASWSDVLEAIEREAGDDMVLEQMHLRTKFERVASHVEVL